MRSCSTPRAGGQGWFVALLGALLLLPAVGQAQGGGWQWGRRLGGTLAFASSGQYDEAGRPAADAAGNVYVTGSYDSPATFGGSPLTLPHAGQLDVLVAKYDSLGRLRWARGAGGSGYDIGTAVATGPTGASVLVTGYSTSSMVFPGPIPRSSSRGGFVANYDSTGTLLWAYHIGIRPNYLLPYSAAVDGAGNCLVLATRDDSLTLGSFHVPRPANGFYDLLLISFSPLGAVNWVRTISPSATNSTRANRAAVVADAAGNVYVSSGVGSGTVQLSPTMQVTIPTPFGLFLARYDAAGTPQWVQTLPYGSTGGLALDPGPVSRHVYLCGDAGTGFSFGGPPVPLTNGQDAFVARYSAQGTLQWGRNGGGSNVPTEGNGVAVNHRGEVFLVALVGDDPVIFGGNLGFTWPTTGAYSLVVKYDSTGVVRGATTTIDTARPQGLALSGEQAPTVVATSGRTVGLLPAASVVTVGQRDVLVARADFRNRPLATQAGGSVSDEWRLYPNPATGASVTLVLPAGHSTGHLRVTDLLGRLLTEKTLLAGSTSWSVAGWPAGVYLVVFQPKGAGAVSAKRLVVE